MVIVGLTGKAFSGKDTFVDCLNIVHATYEIRVGRYALASPLKEAVRILFGFTDAQVNTADGKETVDPFWNQTPRFFLQDLGTEVFRDRYDKNFWIKRAERAVDLQRDDFDVLFITDVRFENEAAWVRARGGIMIHIRRPGSKETRSHASEDGIEFKPELGDHLIVNGGSLESFRWNVHALYGDVVIPKIAVRG